MESKVCKDCRHYKVLNFRHIENGKPKRFCSLGEHPDYCRCREVEDGEGSNQRGV